jgi:hypothetical protein
MGEPIGQQLFEMAANRFNNGNWHVGYGWVYNGQGNTSAEVLHTYVSLLGDPTLRVRPVSPPSAVTVSVQGTDNLIQWTNSSDINIQGYNVYRAPANNLNNFTKLTPVPIVGTYRDSGAASGSYKYYVKAVKLESSLGRSYYTASQGVYATGGTFVAKPGDFNNDGVVNSVDFSMFQSAYNTNNATYDLNKDGIVNTLDYAIISRNWG